MDVKQKTVIKVIVIDHKESFLESLRKDAATFGFLFFGMIGDWYLFGGSTTWSIGFFLLMTFGLFVKTPKKLSLDEAEAYIQRLKEERLN